MNPRLRPLWALLELDGRLVRNALDGVSESRGRARPGDRVNHIAFLGCHLLDARHFLLRLAGGEGENPFAELLAGARGIGDIEEYPSLEAVLEAWRALDGRLEAAFEALTDEALDAPSPQAFPVDDASVLGGIAFLVQHDAYHIGQVCYLRKWLGHDAAGYG